VKARLRRPVLQLTADRTGAPRPATEIQAIGAGRRGDMSGAGRHVVTRRAEGTDRTGRQAGPVVADIARPRPGINWRKLKRRREGQGAAVGVPQAVVGMDQHADRNGIETKSTSQPTPLS